MARLAQLRRHLTSAVQDHELEVRYAAVMAEVRSGVSPQTYEDLLYYVQNPREGDVWALSHQRHARACMRQLPCA